MIKPQILLYVRVIFYQKKIAILSSKTLHSDIIFFHQNYISVVSYEVIGQELKALVVSSVIVRQGSDALSESTRLYWMYSDINLEILFSADMIGM